MFRFESFEENHLLEFLWLGFLDDYIEELYQRWDEFSAKIQFELIRYSRKRLSNFLSPSILAKVLHIKAQDAEIILQHQGKPFEVLLTERDPFDPTKVIVNTCQAIAIPHTSKIITNLPELRSALTTLKKLLGMNFAVFFDTRFIGKSFMLPLATALALENVPADLRFTGALNARGDILEVDHLKEKIAYAKEHGLRLITPLDVKHFEIITTFLKKDYWSLPFYLTSYGKEEVSYFLKFYQGERELAGMDLFKGLKLFYNLSEDSFYLVTGQLKKSQDWEASCQQFYEKLTSIKHRLSGTKVFHFGMRTASALSFALGVLFSTSEPFVFYHYQTVEGKTSYYPLRVDSPRFLKERQSFYRHLKPKFEKRGDDLVVILNFSHHEPVADVKNYVATHLSDPSFLVLETEPRGNIPISAMVEISRESASFLQKIRQEYSFKSYHFFFSCPLPIAFMVGVAFGHYVDGYLYNFQKEDLLYQPVLDFKFLRKLRGSHVRN